LVDYLLVFGLLVLLVVLSLPTMIQLSAALGMDRATSSRRPLVKGVNPLFARVSSPSRPISAPVEPGMVGRAAIEPRLAH